MKTIIIAGLFGLTLSCTTTREKPEKPEFLTKSAKMRECVESFVYKYEIEPKIALEICSHIYRDKK